MTGNGNHVNMLEITLLVILFSADFKSYGISVCHSLPPRRRSRRRKNSCTIQKPASLISTSPYNLLGLILTLKTIKERQPHNDEQQIQL